MEPESLIFLKTNNVKYNSYNPLLLQFQDSTILKVGMPSVSLRIVS